MAHIRLSLAAHQAQHSPDFLASWTAWFRSSFRRPPYWSLHSSRFLLMVLRVSSTLAAVSLASAAAALAFWIVSFVSSAKKEISLRRPGAGRKHPWVTVSAQRREQRESVQPPQNKPCSLPSMSCTDWSWVRSCSFFTRRSASLSFAVCRVPLIAAIKEMHVLFAGAQSSPKDIRSCEKPLSPPLSLLCCLLAASSRLLLFLFSILEAAPRFSDMTFCETNRTLKRNSSIWL